MESVKTGDKCGGQVEYTDYVCDCLDGHENRMGRCFQMTLMAVLHITAWWLWFLRKNCKTVILKAISEPVQ
jgi:hypothetical protein